MILLASVSSGICTMWPIAEICGCLAVHLTYSAHVGYFIPNSFCKHNWLRASILCTSLLVTAQHPEPYRKIGRMQVLYIINDVKPADIIHQHDLPEFCRADDTQPVFVSSAHRQSYHKSLTVQCPLARQSSPECLVAWSSTHCIINTQWSHFHHISSYQHHHC